MKKVSLPAMLLLCVSAARGADCHGTAVEFVSNPVEAAKLAGQQKKLVFVLHVSGYFEDPKFT